MTAQSADKLMLLISFEKRFDSTVQILQQMELIYKEKDSEYCQSVYVPREAKHV